MNRVDTQDSGLERGVPHIRGDEPVFANNHAEVVARSPHPWG